MQSEHSFYDIIPDSEWIVNVLLGQIQANVGRVILPFLRLLWIPDTETEPPGDSKSGVGKKVGRGQGVVLQLGGLDLRVDGGKVGRLSSNGAAILLFYGIAATKYNGLGTLQFVHSDLVRLVQNAARENYEE